MKSFTFVVDLKKTKASDAEIEASSKDGQKGLFEHILNQAIGAKFKEGLGGKMRREFARVLEKLDATQDVLELEESEFEFIESLLAGDDVKFASTQTRLIAMYAENIAAAKVAK